MPTTIALLCRFFDREVPRLATRYDWKIPAIAGFAQAGARGHAPNLALKQYLKALWDGATSDAERLRIARIIVSDWGGVRGNRDSTLLRYVQAATQGVAPATLQGVASYSKIFAIAHPRRFAIYDARVAACLNAVQINGGLARGMAFNYVPGRNTIVGNVATRTGFTQQPAFAPRHLVQRGWRAIGRDQTYATYLALLQACRAERPQHSLTDLEMALFATAEDECRQAMG